MKPALLVVDVQKAFYDISPETVQSIKQAIEYINAAIDLFSARQLPVVCIQHMSDAEGLIPGKEGFDIPDDLRIMPDDLHIRKTYGNAFNKTNLAEKLREMDVDTVIVTGFAAEYCALATYHGARDHDFTAIMLRGSLASMKAENIGFVERICELISYRALEKVLGTVES